MSTTAGVASQEYVAINLAAVAALLLGLASVMVLMSNVLLVVPVVAIVCGIAALRQIGDSNGTQTGKPLALLGMVVAVVMMCYVGVQEVQASRAVSAEQGKIVARTQELSNALVAKDYNRAVSLFSSGFLSRKQMDEAGFADRWQKILGAGSGLYGDLQKVETNGRVLLQGDASTGLIADTMLVFEFTKASAPLRRAAVLRKDESGEWRFEDLPDLFPNPTPLPPDPSRMAPGMSPMTPGASPAMPR
jgi:hypothetical protein